MSDLHQQAKEKFNMLEGKVEWITIVEAENKKYEELLAILREDIDKKKEIIKDMQNS
jgi:hypothetical protein